MGVILTQRCLFHETREAAARCAECRQSFCRECITEHEERIICSACLRRLTPEPVKARRNFSSAARPALLVMGFFCAWLFFYFVGRILVSTPSSFHEGTLWQGSVFEAPE